MTTVRGLGPNELDLILHSPGGSPEATEGMVSYLRKKFDHIRVIVPQAAMSAATMLACAADEIVMGKHSSLGPIDPQRILRNRDEIPYMVPAWAIIENFETARRLSVTSPQLMDEFLFILGQYPPGLIEHCREMQELSTELTSKWLEQYMFKGDKDARRKACETACRLADHSAFKSHARRIDMDWAAEMGLNVTPLEGDQKFQDLVLSVFHAATIGFEHGISKITENHVGESFVKRWPPDGRRPYRPPTPTKNGA